MFLRWPHAKIQIDNFFLCPRIPWIFAVRVSATSLSTFPSNWVERCAVVQVRFVNGILTESGHTGRNRETIHTSGLCLGQRKQVQDRQLSTAPPRSLLWLSIQKLPCPQNYSTPALGTEFKMTGHWLYSKVWNKPEISRKFSSHPHKWVSDFLLQLRKLRLGRQENMIRKPAKGRTWMWS